MRQQLQERIRDFRETLVLNSFLLKKIAKTKGGFTYISIKGIQSLLNAGFPLLSTIVPGMIINELVGSRRVATVFVYVSVLLVTPVVYRVLISGIERKTQRLSKEIQLQIIASFLKHIAEIDYESRENPDNKIKEDIARDTLENAIITVDQIYSLITASLRLICVISLINVLKPFMMVLLLSTVIIGSVFTKHQNQMKNSLDQEWYKLLRYVNMFEIPITQVYYAKEISLFGLSGYFLKKYQEKREESDRLELKKDDYVRSIGVFMAFISFLQEASIYMYAILNVLNGAMKVGDISVLISASQLFSSTITEVFNQYVSIYNNNHRIVETIDFMNLPTAKKESGNLIPVFDEKSLIEFSHVYFKYPGSEHYAVVDCNITISGNDKICIVGKNGSGKSTFIKLLLRLYAPTSGTIFLNGIDIQAYDYVEYVKLFSPVFQDFNIFSGLSIKENVVLAAKYDQARYDNACVYSDISEFIAKQQKGEDTIIDKWVDETGITPSGGEGQRIAVGRSFYHDGMVYLLDEPTAALDPIAEDEIYSRFKEMVKAKAAILVTHRLSAVKLVERVVVFENGKIVESGTHNELYKLGGLYTEMFDKQSEFFTENSNSGC